MPSRVRSFAPLVLLVLAALALLAPAALAEPLPAVAADPLAALAVQQATLTASDGEADDYFGYSVALDGDTALVGAGDRASSTGAAFVFTSAAGVWTQQATLTASDGEADDFFATSVALDGDTALVGAEGHDASRGSAYVFTRSTGVWTQQATLSLSDRVAEDYFGCSVALDGDTALVGACRNGEAGAAYVFTRSAGAWTQQGSALTASDGVAGDYFGCSVALDGDTALVGADCRASSRGAAYVFTRSAGAWRQQGGALFANDGAVDNFFGRSVALDGDTALVGASCSDIDYKGAAYVFTRSAGAWRQQAALTMSDGVRQDNFGRSVALDGDTALVGAQGDASKGAVSVFTRADGAWTQQAALTASDGVAGDCFGFSIALDGDTALVGDVAHGSDKGAAYVFTFPAPTPIPPAKPIVSKLSPTAGKRGATVTITGSAFGRGGSISHVKFGAKKCAKYVSWSATRIKCRVPARAKFGRVKITVVTGSGASNAKAFTVKR